MGEFGEVGSSSWQANFGNNHLSGNQVGKPVLNLALNITQSLVDDIAKCLNSNSNTGKTKANKRTYKKRKVKNIGPPDPAQNIYPICSSFSAILLRIGEWEVKSHVEKGIMAKFFHRSKKIAWEILRDGNYIYKLEMDYSSLHAIRAVFNGVQPSFLELELNQPPMFCSLKEENPGVVRCWNKINDFTNNQASNFRKHHLEFPNGKLEQEYEKLLNHDKALHELSQTPFSNDLYFGPIHKINRSLINTQMPINKLPLMHSSNRHNYTTNLGFHHPLPTIDSSSNSLSIVPHPNFIHGVPNQNFSAYLTSSNTFIPYLTPPLNFNHGLTAPSTAYVCPTSNFNHGLTPSNFDPLFPPQNQSGFPTSNLNSSYASSSSQLTPLPTPNLDQSATISVPMPSNSPISDLSPNLAIEEEVIKYFAIPRNEDLDELLNDATDATYGF